MLRLICWESAVILAFGLYSFTFCRLIVCVPVPFCVLGWMWNWIVSAPGHCLSSILSQIYNATVFYLGNISFLDHALNQLFLSNESSIILPHNGFKNLFPTVQETNHFMEVWWLKKFKLMLMYQYPTCDMHFKQRKRYVDF